MLESGTLGGKCADLNALFVGLLRASDIPARDIYGVRVAPSKFGYKSLAPIPTSSQGQHCPLRSISRASAGCRRTRRTCARWFGWGSRRAKW